MQERGHNLYLTLNGTLVCYDDLGQGEIPVLFLHGFPFDKSCWDPQMAALQQEHRVIAYDIRGFGKSTTSPEIPSISMYADDLIQFIDQLGIVKAIVCGISMGGYIVLNAVKRFPDKFQAIILSDTQCIADSPEAKEKRKASITQVMSGRLTEFAEQFISKVFNLEAGKHDEGLIATVKHIILSTSPETITGALNALKNREETCTSLHHINIPSLIICGDGDKLTPPAKSDELHSKIANSEYYLIPDAGHLSNLDQPLLFNQRIKLFIEKVASEFNYSLSDSPI